MDELFSLIRFLGIRPLNEWETFNTQIAKPIKAGKQARAMKKLHVRSTCFKFMVFGHDLTLSSSDCAEIGDVTTTERRHDQWQTAYCVARSHNYHRKLPFQYRRTRVLCFVGG